MNSEIFYGGLDEGAERLAVNLWDGKVNLVQFTTNIGVLAVIKLTYFTRI